MSTTAEGRVYDELCTVVASAIRSGMSADRFLDLSANAWEQIHTEDWAEQGYPVAIQKAANAAASSLAPPAPTEDELCEHCEKEPAVERYENGYELCVGCAKIHDAKCQERERIMAYCARLCDEQVTGFKSEAHEEYDQGAKDCARAIRAELDIFTSGQSGAAPRTET